MFEKLNSILDGITSFPGSVVDFFTDPIWALGGMVAGIVLLCIIGRYFYQSPLWGAAAVGAVLYAIGFRKGQKAEDERNRAETDQLKEQIRNQSNQGWWR